MIGKRPGTRIDLELKLEKNVFEICREVSGTVIEVARTAEYMSLVKQKIIVKYIIESQFNHFTLMR